MFTCCSVSPLSHCEDSWNIHSNWLETFLSYNNMTHVNFFPPPTRPLVSLISGVHRGRRARKSHSATRARQNSHPVWMALQMAPLRTEPQQLIEMWLKSQRSPVQYPNLSSCIFLIKAKKPSHFFLKRKKKNLHYYYYEWGVHATRTQTQSCTQNTSSTERPPSFLWDEEKGGTWSWKKAEKGSLHNVRAAGMDGIRVEYIVEGEPEHVRCSGDEKQTEAVWMQRLEGERRVYLWM